MLDYLLVAEKIVPSEIRIDVFIGGVNVAVEQNRTDQKVTASARQRGQTSPAHNVVLVQGAVLKAVRKRVWRVATTTAADAAADKESATHAAAAPARCRRPRHRPSGIVPGKTRAPAPAKTGCAVRL